MTDSRVKSRHNLIELFRGSNAESLDLDLFYHLGISLRTTAPWIKLRGLSRLRSSDRRKRRPGRRRRRSSRHERLERPKVTVVVDVEILLSAHWRGFPPQHCSASHYAERRHDSDP